MNAQSYLEGYGWTIGQPLKKGGLRKPVLVKHKKDNKGLGHTQQVHDSWWERVFDGQLKSLQVNTGKKSVGFNVEQAEFSGVAREISPLYRMFVYGGTLKGTLTNQPTASKPSDPVAIKSKSKSKKSKSTKSKSKSKSKSKIEKTTKTKKSKREEKPTASAWIQHLISTNPSNN